MHSENFTSLQLADRNIRALSSLSDVCYQSAAGGRKKKRKREKRRWRRERNEAEKKCRPRVQQLKVHYADCRVRMLPFRETNFSFTVTLSVGMIRNGLERRRGQSHQIGINHRDLNCRVAKSSVSLRPHSLG